jgi:hypothetical protein
MEGAKALADCLVIFPGNLQDAKDDPELAALRETAEGQKILSIN